MNASTPIPIDVAYTADFSSVHRSWAPHQKAMIEALKFEARSGAHVLLFDEGGALERVVWLLDPGASFWLAASLQAALPAGDYVWGQYPPECDADRWGFAWHMAQYRFDRYLKQKPVSSAQLLTPLSEKVQRLVEAMSCVRDWINTPAQDAGPEPIEAWLRSFAKQYGLECESVVGEALLEKGLRAIHAVGRASPRAPRLLRLSYGQDAHPLICLVGKGVCFDSGGLNIKDARGMRLMKKDMGGAAHVMALAALIVQTKLPVRLLLLIPLADNMISGDAFRPGDVIEMHSGLTVEIGDTDAEGRLLLADALSYAQGYGPADLTIDFSTLTGAARVAVGTEIAAYFSSDDGLAMALEAHALIEEDPVARLPLYAPYRKLLDSKIADMSNVGGGSYAGAITAALFLQSFVGPGSWLHVDMMAWNVSHRPGRPEGGEAMGLRALWALLCDRYAL